MMKMWAAYFFGWRYYLVAEWFEGAHHFCKYSDGTILNLPMQICPLSILVGA